MSLTFEEVLKSTFAKTIKDVLDEREQRIKTDGDKQDALESGVNIKTVNGQSILGAGNIEVAGADMANVKVSTRDWNADDTYADFPYKAAIHINNTREDLDAFYEVVFDVPEATSGNYAPVCYYDPNGAFLYIWAKEIPDHDITIPLIKQIL